MSGDWQAGPPRPAPPLAEVHVWQVDLDAAGTPPDGVLTAAERERGERVRADAGRHWAASRWALRAVLSIYLDERPEAIELVLGEHGKPALAGPEPRLEFNLSHSAGLALVAVATAHPVGIDVERVERERDFLALAERGLDGRVVAELEAAPPERRAAIFYAAWARHEARLKCHGGGLGGPPPTGPVSVTDIALGDGYAAALAVPGETPPAVLLYRLDLR